MTELTPQNIVKHIVTIPKIAKRNAVTGILTFDGVSSILTSEPHHHGKTVFEMTGVCPMSIWRCHPDLNWGVELLQSSALPLGYGTIYK